MGKFSYCRADYAPASCAQKEKVWELFDFWQLPHKVPSQLQDAYEQFNVSLTIIVTLSNTGVMCQIWYVGVLFLFIKKNLFCTSFLFYSPLNPVMILVTMVFMNLRMEKEWSSTKGMLLTKATFIAKRCFVTHKAFFLSFLTI